MMGSTQSKDVSNLTGGLNKTKSPYLECMYEIISSFVFPSESIFLTKMRKSLAISALEFSISSFRQTKHLSSLPIILATFSSS